MKSDLNPLSVLVCRLPLVSKEYTFNHLAFLCMCYLKNQQ